LLAEVTISTGVLEWGFGLLVVQLLAAIGWGIKLQMAVNGLKQDIAAMKAWQGERMKPIEDYYHRQEQLTNRIVTLEEQTRTVFKMLEKMDAKLDRLIEADHK
jgi:hypothetical protein